MATSLVGSNQPFEGKYTVYFAFKRVDNGGVVWSLIEDDSAWHEAFEQVIERKFEDLGYCHGALWLIKLTVKNRRCSNGCLVVNFVGVDNCVGR